ncbi:MAG: ACT domain-containing protein [Patescibacteria group bacterium]
MNQNKLDQIIKNSTAIVHKGQYAYLKLSRYSEINLNNHFFVSQDQDEITIVTEKKNIDQIDYTDEVKWFKLIEIKVAIPFLAKGFLAKITQTIASVDLNVLVVSTFSKDYILVREETYEIAINTLKEAGFPVENET